MTTTCQSRLLRREICVRKACFLHLNLKGHFFCIAKLFLLCSSTSARLFLCLWQLPAKMKVAGKQLIEQAYVTSEVYLGSEQPYPGVNYFGVYTVEEYEGMVDKSTMDQPVPSHLNGSLRMDYEGICLRAVSSTQPQSRDSESRKIGSRELLFLDGVLSGMQC